MTQPRPAPARAAGAAALVGVLTLTAACGPQPVGPDDVDARRLTALEQAMPVDGDQVPSPARAAAGSSNVVAYRAETATTLPLDGPPGADGNATVWATGTDLLTTLRDAGWAPAMVSCEVAATGDASAEIIATRPLDGFTAAAQVTVEHDAATVTLFAPFHTDPADLWAAGQWQLTPLDGATCLDPGAAQPARPDEPDIAGQVPEQLSLGDVLP